MSIKEKFGEQEVQQCQRRRDNQLGAILQPVFRTPGPLMGQIIAHRPSPGDYRADSGRARFAGSTNFGLDKTDAFLAAFASISGT